MEILIGGYLSHCTTFTCNIKCTGNSASVQISVRIKYICNWKKYKIYYVLPLRNYPFEI